MSEKTISIGERLRELGRSSEEVAGNLAKRKIKGTHNRNTCPTAQFVKEILPEGFRFGISSSNWTVTTDGEGIIASGLPPTPVIDFIRDFDNFQYPSLVGEPTTTTPEVRIVP